MKVAKVFLTIIFFSLCFTFHSQTDTELNPETTIIQDVSENQNNDDEGEYLYISQDDQNLLNESTSRSSSVWLFVRMILVLLVVIGCMYGLMWFLKHNMKKSINNNDQFLRKVASIDVAVGKTVQVVTLIDRAYVIGVSDGSVSLIAELGDSEKEIELINAMNLYADKQQNVKKPKSFADVLDIFMPSGPRGGNSDKNTSENKEKNVFSGLQNKLNDFVSEQRNKLSELDKKDEVE